MKKTLTHIIEVLTVIAIALWGVNAYGIHQAKQNTAPVPEEPVQTEPVVEDYNASLFMLGDSLIHGAIFYQAYLQAGGNGYDFSGMIDRVASKAAAYDLRYYNEETIIGGDEFGAQHYPTFNTPHEWADLMRSWGFNLVSTATNHTFDMGVQGIENSVHYWEQYPEVVTAGTYLSQVDADAIPIHDVNGITYAFLSYTYGLNGFELPEDQPYLVNIWEGHEEEMYQKIREAKAKADAVIVAIHWGTEYSDEATPEQREMAKKMVDAGATVIIGNHVHTVQPIERIGDSVVFYALGNMISAQFEVFNQIGIMGALNLHKHVENGVSTTTVEDVRADLFYIYMNSQNQGFQLVPFNEMTDDTWLPDHEAVYEQYKQKITEYDPSIQVGLK